MNDLKTNFDSFMQLITGGKTLEAIEQFFDNNIKQYENTAPPVIGKQKLWDMEKKNLEGVNSLNIQVVREVIDEEKGIVWGEMYIQFESKKMGLLNLNEAFFQQWKNGKITEQKFFYKEIQPALK